MLTDILICLACAVLASSIAWHLIPRATVRPNNCTEGNNPLDHVRARRLHYWRNRDD